MKLISRAILTAVFVAMLSLLIVNCYSDNHIKGFELNQRIQALIEAKATQCGNRPAYPLFFTREASPAEVEKCETDMINKTCPFNSYPWSCVRIF